MVRKYVDVAVTVAISVVVVYAVEETVMVVVWGWMSKNVVQNASALFLMRILIARTTSRA